MGNTHKTLAKVHKGVQKYTLGNKVVKGVVGEETYDKLHPGGTWSTREAAKIEKAEQGVKDAEALAAEQRALQKTAMAELDEEENRRIKKIISGSRGTRNYRGGPMFRGRASNKAGPATSAASAGNSSPSAAVLRDAGTRGGLARSGFRSLIP